MLQYPVALQTHNFNLTPVSPEPETPVPENLTKVTKITNCRILRDHKIVEKDAIWIQDGKIIDPHKFFWYQKRLPDEVLDAQGLIVSPGFIEAQINGAFGVDFSLPLDHDKYEKGILKVSRGLLKYGTTSYCPTIVSSSSKVYHKVLPHLKPRAGSVETGATIIGAHVEGPFINKARHGAHELKVLQASANNGYMDFKDVYGFECDTPEAQRILSDEDLAGVKIVTCAPELEGVMDSIPDLVKAGITISIGHSMANISQAEESVTKGATFITHLFNAMPQFHHRDPGVIGLLGSRLDLPRPYYGLICDGIHVHPNSIKIAYDSHPEGVILVTDAMSAMGLLPGTYRLGNMSVTKEEDRVYIKGTDTLAGRESDDTCGLPHVQSHRTVDDDNGDDITKYHPRILGAKTCTPDLESIRNKISKTASAGPMNPSTDYPLENSNESFLPTPPGSSSLSPMRSIPHSLRDSVQLPLPEAIHTSNSTVTTTSSYEMTFTTIHYYEYDEYHVYEDFEEHEGSGHSLRILSLHIIDDDDDDDDDDLEDYQHTSVESRDISQSDHQAQDQIMKSTGVQLEMSEHVCNHGNNGESGYGDESGECQNAFKVTSNANDDGDFCCPSSSVITLDECIRNFIKFTHCSVIEALEAVTLHPASLLGIQEKKGVIKPGADADLVFLSDDLYVKRVFVAGEEVDLKAIDNEIIERI
ncbi:putative N-acetylglucosamine-6-phosphate deacetylase [Entomortierella beljakovae]|nr:putative N-acetylglucosamine-6-phosphate deacetylase [Entomortierella beljakovae]